MDYKSPIGIYTLEPFYKEMEDGVIQATISCGAKMEGADE